MNSLVYYRAAVPFEAALKLEVLPQGHRSKGLHGHSFMAKVRAPEAAVLSPFEGGEVETLAAQLKEVVKPLNYSFLNM